MGFVKLPHDLRSWGWVSEPKTLAVYIHLLLNAAWVDTEYKGVHLDRGQALISQRDFAEKCGVTRQELRTILQRLTSTHKITQSATRKNTVVTLLEYDPETLSGATKNSAP